MATPRVFLRILSVYLLVGCTYEEPVVRGSEELIAGTDAFGKDWHIAGIELLSLGELKITPCLADNIIRYYPNYTYEVSDVEKCHPEDPPAITGTWSFSRDGSLLIVRMPDSVMTWELEALSASEHHLVASFHEGTRRYTLRSSR